jgi:hypothetical protein
MISFFTHINLMSARIRAVEMSQYLGAKLNPKDGYENDVCIYVKPNGLNDIKDGAWVDFLDSNGNVLAALRNRPQVKVIAASQNSYDYLKKYLYNQIVLIPSHHVNHDRIKRDRKEFTMGGYIGGPSPMVTIRYNEVTESLKKIGLNFTTYCEYKTRQDAIDFYKKIDFFVMRDFDDHGGPHRIPTKIVNASSFGIPVIASPQMGNKEVEGYYLSANNMNEIISCVEQLKNQDLYNEWSGKIMGMAEKYHISHIAEMYKELK